MGTHPHRRPLASGPTLSPSLTAASESAIKSYLRSLQSQRSLSRALTILTLALAASVSAQAQLSVGIGLPGVSIGINLPLQPQLVRVPGYPVYYAPQVQSNFFFYDGMYWVYEDDDWYASSWYNGPWRAVQRDVVPLYVLRVPVRYYRAPPPYFRSWRADAPPRWDDHWGNDWSRQRRGWDQWDRKRIPAPAPLPTYQRQYPDSRYPAPEQQPQLQQRNYRYEPRDPVVRQHREEQVQHANPPPRSPQVQQPQPPRPPPAPAAERPDRQDRQRPDAGRGADGPPQHEGRRKPEKDRDRDEDRGGDRKK